VPNDNYNVESLSPEIVAFCALLARILYRCLQERDPRIVSLIGVPQIAQEVSHEQAA
jgi:hypothetical protein